ncbi:hypothetical protein BC834DRAFT_58466 [Gloeopeniophorella convolvens]|nr:hypothetical protein BC834DRAFT_58466 [Gloeopeniophorella convolvens]
MCAPSMTRHWQPQLHSHPSLRLNPCRPKSRRRPRRRHRRAPPRPVRSRAPPRRATRHTPPLRPTRGQTRSAAPLWASRRSRPPHRPLRPRAPRLPHRAARLRVRVLPLQQRRSRGLRCLRPAACSPCRTPRSVRTRPLLLYVVLFALGALLHFVRRLRITGGGRNASVEAIEDVRWLLGGAP